MFSPILFKFIWIMNNLELSRYTYLFLSSKKNNMVYNSRSNALFEVSKELFSQLQKCKEDKTYITSLDEEAVKFLLERKVFVIEGDDDDFILQQQYRTDTRTYAKSILTLTIVPTLGCNCSCFYCFEENKRPTTMDGQTIDAVINFINSHTEARKLNLCWYGGEPLMAKNIIESLLKKIKNETKIELAKHHIVTNGVYFDQKAIDLFKEFPLNELQITLDGRQERHDSIRYTKSGLPTYERIIRNIDNILNALPNTTIQIRINIEKENANDYRELRQKLGERWKNKNVCIYPGFLRIDNENKTAYSCSSFDRKEIAEFLFDAEMEGLYNTELYPQQLLCHRTCGATQKNAYIIGPEGEIYKCWNDVSNPERVVGNIHDKIFNEKLLTRYIVGSKWYHDQACRECFYLPICNGACAWYALRNRYENGKYDLCTCMQKVPGMLEKCLEQYHNTHIETQ